MNGNIDIRYDDGDSESNVSPSLVRSNVAGSGGGSGGSRPQRRGSFSGRPAMGGMSRTPVGKSPRSPRRRLESGFSDLD